MWMAVVVMMSRRINIQDLWSKTVRQLFILIGSKVDFIECLLTNIELFLRFD